MNMRPDNQSHLVIPPMGAGPAIAREPNPEEQITDYLQQLYTRAMDAIEGYKHAAILTDNPELTLFFVANAEQREQFALELEGHLRQRGIEPDDGSSITGKLHQTWMAVVSKFSGDETGLLDECERGEEAAINDYEEALSSFQLPTDVVATVERQRDQLREELRNLKTLQIVAVG
ncbi:ferritin-like domain-containing protein [Roseibacillus persicicus]|uniref:DUF2383 domain-containing protein n=1 Tax=Roseibacillus persicicus TaxID=454148 RepID=A0A918TH53_9BACT|nr:PA2169 family four-helix-bundle protein [Roseibacillus persicicus]GHC41478.1 hypothetical protein GCM10007100_02820 [Roseibacillus persicicus]